MIDPQPEFDFGATPQPDDNSAAARLADLGIGIVYLTSPAAAHAAATRLAATGRAIGFDIETAKHGDYLSSPQAGLAPHLSRIRLAQFYDGGERVYVTDIDHTGLAALAPLWDHPLVAHNALFELKHLLHASVRPSRLGCTLLQGHALTGRRRSLAQLVSAELGWDLSKELQVSDWNRAKLSGAQIAYAALDAVAVFRLSESLQAKVARFQARHCYQLMRDVQPAVASMELNGIHFDRDRHAELTRQWHVDLDRASTALTRFLGPQVSPASGKQLSDWLRRHLDEASLESWPSTATGLLRTNAETLSRYRHLDLVQPLLAHKDAAKKLSTYGTGFADHIDPVTGRMHPSFVIGGSNTGRFACYGPNMLNPLRDPAFRSLFAAPPGRRMVVADYGQIELRAAALVSEDQAMLAAYRDGIDLHMTTAAAVSGKPIADLDRKGPERQLAKAVNFGLLYGQGANGLARYAAASYGVTMSVAEAAAAQAAFFQAYSDLHRWQRRSGDAARLTRRLATRGGRTLARPADARPFSYPESLNFPIQGAAAEVLLACLARLDPLLRPLDAKLVNAVHDELVLEVADADVAPATAALTEAMVGGFLDIFPEADFMTSDLVEARAGIDWAAAK